MRTPAGKECKFYYQDYHRGKETQECRLIDRNPQSGSWKPSHCGNCPVPGILLANACPNMVMEAHIARGFLGLTERVEVYAICSQQMCEVKEPRIGCGSCHQLNAPSSAI